MKAIETMRLMAVRPAQLIDQTSTPQIFIVPEVYGELTPPQIAAMETTTPLLYFKLKNILNDDEKITLAAAKAMVEVFNRSVHYVSSITTLMNDTEGLRAIYNIMKNLTEESEISDVVAKIESIVAGEITSAWEGMLESRVYSWENLFSQHILGGNTQALELLVIGQKAIYFMNQVVDNMANEDYNIYEEAQNVLHARIKVPYSVILPLPLEDADPLPEVKPDDEEYVKSVEGVSKLSELLYRLSVIYDQKLAKFRKLSNLKEEGTAPEITNSDFEFVDFSIFDEKETHILGEIGIDIEEDYTYGAVSQRIEKTLANYIPMLATKVRTEDRMVVIGTTLVNADKLCAHLAARDMCARYTGPTLPQGKGNIQPIGIADLKVLETSLYKYELGEIAHIENVLKGEHKEKTFKDLRRTEETFISEEENMSEKVRDTQTTERFEMQKEVSNVVSQQTQFDAGLTVTASYGSMVSITAGTNYATASSQQQSDSASQNYAKEITEKAVDRVVKRSRTQQSITRIHETEETNVHGINNSVSPVDNIAGVYRWVNKVYYNKLKNYGKRMMFEIMIPEPAAFYIYSKLVGGGEKILPKIPINPLKGDAWPYSAITSPTSLNETNYFLWTSLYDVQDTTPPPPQFLTVNRAINIQKVASTSESANYSGTVTANNFDFNAQSQISNDIEIPEGYVGKLVKLLTLKSWQVDSDMQLNIADQWRQHGSTWPVVLDNLTGKIPVGIVSRNCFGTVNLVVNCERSGETMRNWQIKTFDSIMRGYNRKLEEYNAELRSMQTSEGIVIKGNNPLKNRETEKEELKKASISVVTGQRFETFDALVGADPNNMTNRYPEFHFGEAKAEGNYIHYFEQAFDWKNIAYQFYPYFWGRKPNWLEAKRLEDNDTVFEKFLQAGSARVLVPVSLGYEESVLHYLQTGVIWHGSESIVGTDAYYNTIFADLNQPIAADISEPWLNTVPTDLVYLQSLDTLPVLPDNSSDFPAII